jgi:hypothetical protein
MNRNISESCIGNILWRCWHRGRPAPRRASQRLEKFGDATRFNPDVFDGQHRPRRIFYVGGEYAGPAGKEVMHGPMYVEVMVPKQIKQKYPIVFFHGNGQSGTVWEAKRRRAPRLGLLPD